jgi:phage terminase small subunit
MELSKMPANAVTIRPLSDRQKMFCREYLVDLNATQAYIRAGYSETGAQTSASKLLSNPLIRAHTDSVLAKRAEKVEISVDYVLGGIKGIVDRCTQELRPVLDRRGAPVTTEGEDGTPCPLYTFDAANGLRGLELLGKYKRLFNDSAPEVSIQVAIIQPDADPDQAARVYRDMME